MCGQALQLPSRCRARLVNPAANIIDKHFWPPLFSFFISTTLWKTQLIIISPFIPPPSNTLICVVRVTFCNTVHSSSNSKQCKQCCPVDFIFIFLYSILCSSFLFSIMKLLCGLRTADTAKLCEWERYRGKVGCACCYCYCCAFCRLRCCCDHKKREGLRLSSSSSVKSKLQLENCCAAHFKTLRYDAVYIGQREEQRNKTLEKCSVCMLGNPSKYGQNECATIK